MNDVKLMILNSAYKHIAGRKNPAYKEIKALNVLKNEEFGLQLLIESETEFLTVSGQYMDIAWKGLIEKIRVEAVASSSSEHVDLSKYFQIMLVDYVLDDGKNLLADKLLQSKAMLSVENQQLVYISGKVPAMFSEDKVNLALRIYCSKGYEDERLIAEKNVTINVASISLPDLKESGFYIDLWQHPSNWARIYDVPYYSEEHMDIIDNYLEGMARLGQGICNLIISDYPWAG